MLDARDPEGCRCPDVERYVRSLDPNKRVILLLNKMGGLRSWSGCDTAGLAVIILRFGLGPAC